MRSTIIITGVAAMALGLGTAAQAQVAATPATRAAPAAGLSDADKAWLQETANGAEYEKALTTLGTKRAAKADVKTYADSVLKDHEALNTALEDVARRHGLTLVPKVGEPDAAKLTAMAGLSNAGFDKAFLEEMKRINAEDKGKLQDVVATTRDPQVKQFAQQMQAADTRHEAMAQAIKD